MLRASVRAYVCACARACVSLIFFFANLSGTRDRTLNLLLAATATFTKLDQQIRNVPFSTKLSLIYHGENISDIIASFYFELYFLFFDFFFFFFFFLWGWVCFVKKHLWLNS